MVKISVKWGKQKYDDIEVNVAEPVAVLKAQLYALTGVPADRQKIMGVKGGMLRDDADLATLDIKPNQQLMLMGTAEAQQLKAPEQRTLFEEDLSPEERAKALREKTGEPVPAGLVNLGNTCYMNSTLQCLRTVRELGAALNGFEGGLGGDPNANMTAATRDLFRQLERSGQPVDPLVFVNVLRTAYPQFSQQERGRFMQQDAEECWSAILSALAAKLRASGDAASANLIDDLFGVEMETRYQNVEEPAEPAEVRVETLRKLPCHIDNSNQPINHLHEGVRLSLEETVEKHSPALQRNCQYRKSARIRRLPPYLMVQFVRFLWKRASAVAGTEAGKAKILRNVSFPAVLDVFDFCSDELKAQLAVGRELDRARRGLRSERADGSGPAPMEEEKKAEAPHPAALGPAADSAVPMEVDASAMTADASGETLDAGMYELVGVVTHKGRQADGGHYVSWIRKRGDEWLKFDDDEVTPCDTEEIMKLRGGGDWHMAYLCLYRKLSVPKN